MANPHTTLASLWVDDGQGSPIKVTPTTPSKSKSELRDDFKKFYQETGLDVYAKESGIMDANGDLTGFKDAGKQSVQYVAVPISNTPMKTSSPFKDQPQLLPKAVNTQPQGSPMMVASSPHASVVTVDSPWSTRKRGAELTIDPSDYPDYGSGKRAKKGEKGGKGLRHFSMKVCEKVQKKGVTSYNEVADELVAEFSDPRNLQSPSDQALAYDQKNIRRRVYDALNVLMAMNIISKEKKEIRWIGLPTNSAQECHNLEIERQKKIDKIKHKTQQLQELILQQIAFKNLVQRNRENEKRNDVPAPNSSIHLPFIIISTNKKTVIDCSISNDKYEYLFTFNNMFEIHDDIEVLKRMGMAFGLEKGQCVPADLAKAVKLVPRALETYVQDMATNSNVMPSREIRPMDPLAVGVHQAGRFRQGASTSSYLGGPEMDQEVAAASASILSRQSSVCSDLPSRTATDTPSENYSDEDSDSDEVDLG